MTQPTRSRDGVPRMSVRIDYRLTAEDVVSILCWDARIDPTDVPDHLSKRAADQIIRRALRDTGVESVHYWRDDVMDYEQADLEAWAKAEVHRLYPKFGGPR